MLGMSFITCMFKSTIFNQAVDGNCLQVSRYILSSQDPDCFMWVKEIMLTHLYFVCYNLVFCKQFYAYSINFGKYQITKITIRSVYSGKQGSTSH